MPECRKLTVEQEFRVCPSCDYERGFHAAFVRLPSGRFEVRLICPNCGAVYDIGLKVDLPAEG